MTVEALQPAFSRQTVPHHSHGGEDLPIRIIIGDRPYVISELSEDGSAVVEFDGQAEPGQILQTKLLVALDGLRLSMPAMWEVRSCVPGQAQLVLQLADTNSPSHLARISSFIRAIVHGDLIDASDVLDIARKKHLSEPVDDFTRENQHPVPASAGQRIRRRIGAVLFVLLAVGLLAFIAANLVSRALIIKADGMIVNAQAMVARAPENAEFVSFSVPVGTRLTPGAAVATIKSPSGQFLTVSSPCDCVVTGQFSDSRFALRRNDPIAQLVPVDSVNKALLTLPKEALRRVRVGDQVTATFYDSNGRLSGTVERVSPPKVVTGAPAQNSGSSGTIEVRFSEKLPAWRVGEPILARIVLSQFNPFA